MALALAYMKEKIFILNFCLHVRACDALQNTFILGAAIGFMNTYVKHSIKLFVELSLIVSVAFGINVMSTQLADSALKEGEQSLQSGDVFFVKIIAARENRIMVRNIGHGSMKTEDISLRINETEERCVWTREYIESMKTAICDMPRPCIPGDSVKVYFQSVEADVSACLG